MWISKLVEPQKAQFNESQVSPATWDWRDYGVVTPARDQTEKCGSCWAFSTIASVESHYAIETGNLVELSEQQLVDCSTENSGCRGGNAYMAYNHIINNGISARKDYPYEAKEGECQGDNVVKSDVKVFGFAEVPSKNDSALVDAIAQFGPITVSINGKPFTFNFYTEGVYHDPECDESGLTNHAVVIVGYGTDEKTNMDYWIVKNSASDSYGENGYIKMARNQNSTCGINSYPYYPLLVDNGLNSFNYIRYKLIGFLLVALSIVLCCCCCCCCMCRRCCKRNKYRLY